MPVPLPRQHQNDLLNAYYELASFADNSSVTVDAAGGHAQLDPSDAKGAFERCKAEGLVERPTFGPQTYLTVEGRMYVESLNKTPKKEPTPIINVFNAPITNSQIASGYSVVQTQTNNNVDSDLLDRFFELVKAFDTSVLNEPTQADFAEDLEIIESHRVNELEPSVVRRAFRSIQTIAMSATGSASGSLLASFVTEQML